MIMFKSIWQGVCVSVVDQGVISISPGEFLNTLQNLFKKVFDSSNSNLCPNPEMVVLYKWRRLHVAGLRENEGAHMGESDHRTGGKYKQILPEFPI